MTAYLDDLRARTLEFVNQIRVLAELEPVAELTPGIPDSPIHCPVAMALNCTVGRCWMMFSDPDTAHAIALAVGLGYASKYGVAMPQYVVEFVWKFDCREYPDLIVDAVYGRLLK